jgi:chemotaxis protein CheC
MPNITTQDKAKPEMCNLPIVEGITNAIKGISQMIGHEIKIDSIEMGQIPTKDISNIFGGDDAPAIGTYLAFSGAANGHFLIAYKPELAYTLLNMATGNNPGIFRTLKEMDQSTLGEMGNIMGISFLDALQNTLGVSLQLSTPVVLLDRARALLDIALTEILQEHNSIFIVKSMLDVNQRKVQGIFLIALDSGFIQTPLKISGKPLLENIECSYI